MTPEDYIEQVEDEVSFLKFIAMLGEDWRTSDATDQIDSPHPLGPGALGWENGTIGSFLEAAAACGTSHLKKGGILPAGNPWRIAAEILLAGKYYE